MGNMAIKNQLVTEVTGAEPCASANSAISALATRSKRVVALYARRGRLSTTFLLASEAREVHEKLTPAPNGGQVSNVSFL